MKEQYIIYRNKIDNRINSLKGKIGENLLSCEDDEDYKKLDIVSTHSEILSLFRLRYNSKEKILN